MASRTGTIVASAAGSAAAEDAKLLPSTDEVNLACCEATREAALKIDMAIWFL